MYKGVIQKVGILCKNNLHMKKLLGKVFLTTTTVILGTVATFAQSTTTSTTTPSTGTEANCMTIALEKRENALITANDTYSEAVKLALQTRLNNLKSSWAQSDRKIRIEKRLAAYKTFKNDLQAANNVLRNSKSAIWKTYQNDAKVCGIKGTGEAPTTIPNWNISL